MMKDELFIVQNTNIIAHRYFLFASEHIHLINKLICHVLFSVRIVFVILLKLIERKKLFNLIRKKAKIIIQEFAVLVYCLFYVFILGFVNYYIQIAFFIHYNYNVINK